MKQTLTTADCIAVLEQMARDIEAAQDRLTALDSALGDGDHGVSMTLGFRAVSDKLPTVVDKDIETVLKTAGMALVSSVGGAAGPLFGSALMRIGMSIGPKQQCILADLAPAAAAAAESIAQRGDCKLGDKTLLDVVVPATEALKAAATKGKQLVPALEEALVGAQQGLESTRNLICRRGRVSRFGERAIGHLDPGAASTTILLESLVNTVKNLPE